VGGAHVRPLHRPLTHAASKSQTSPSLFSGMHVIVSGLKGLVSQ
jgi:hypothetical protein